MKESNNKNKNRNKREKQKKEKYLSKYLYSSRKILFRKINCSTMLEATSLDSKIQNSGEGPGI